jgi:uncharacterized protein (DUF697 family)
LFLCKAKEVDARIKEDIGSLRQLRTFIKDEHSYIPPIVAIATQVDELDPKRIDPPFIDDLKQKNIRQAVDTITKALAAEGIELVVTIPVSAYAEIDENNSITYTAYWNVETLVVYLIEHLPKSTQMQFARITKIRSVQNKMADTLIGMSATICAAFGIQPIPIADIIPITATQVTMLIGIGYIAGRELNKETAKEFLLAMGINVGGAFVLREAARALMKFFLPIYGNIVSAAMAFGGTWGIGSAAKMYFIEEATIEEAKQKMMVVLEQKKAEYK